jgi:hypothetical protein
VLHRYTLFLLLLVLVAALVVPAGADRDDNMIVGRANGAKGYNTSLYSTNPSATLTLVNNRSGGAPALDLQVKAGPSLAVSTSAWIQKLNADYIDGYQANALVRASGCGHTDAPDGTDYQCTFTIVAPKPGYVVLGGSADLSYDGTTWDNLSCRYDMSSGVGYGTVPGTSRNLILDSSPAGSNGLCATDGWTELTSSGTYSFRFVVAGVDSHTDLDSAIGTGTFTPFNGYGTSP